MKKKILNFCLVFLFKEKKQQSIIVIIMRGGKLITGFFFLPPFPYRIEQAGDDILSANRGDANGSNLLPAWLFDEEDPFNDASRMATPEMPSQTWTGEMDDELLLLERNEEKEVQTASGKRAPELDAPSDLIPFLTRNNKRLGRLVRAEQYF